MWWCIIIMDNDVMLRVEIPPPPTTNTTTTHHHQQQITTADEERRTTTTDDGGRRRPSTPRHGGSHNILSFLFFIVFVPSVLIIFLSLYRNGILYSDVKIPLNQSSFQPTVWGSESLTTDHWPLTTDRRLSWVSSSVYSGVVTRHATP